MGDTFEGSEIKKAMDQKKRHVIYGFRGQPNALLDRGD
jgi:hypothetical protein